MATSSLLGGTEMPDTVAGKDTDALGPSDNSDSGSDAQGAYGEDELLSDSDAAGTGERASIGSNAALSSDIMPDHIEREPGSDDDGDDLDDLEGTGGMVRERSLVDNLASDDEESEDEEDEDEDDSDRDELDFETTFERPGAA